MGGMNNLAAIGMNMALTQEARRRDDRRARKERTRKIAELDEKTAKAVRSEHDALAARIASARARAGAAGTGTTGGAIDALVRGLEQETETDIAGLMQERRNRVEGLLQSSASGRKRNLLDFASVLSGFPAKRGRGYRSLLD